MAKKKVARLPKIPQKDLLAALVAIERVVSHAQSQIGLIKLVLDDHRRDGADLDTGHVFYCFDVLNQVESDLVNLVFPMGLPYHHSFARREGAA